MPTKTIRPHDPVTDDVMEETRAAYIKSLAELSLDDRSKIEKGILLFALMLAQSNRNMSAVNAIYRAECVFAAAEIKVGKTWMK